MSIAVDGVHAQRHGALQVGNQVRIGRAKDKRRWKREGRPEVCKEAAGLIQAAPHHWRNAKVSELLLAIPGVGQSKATTLMVRHQVSPHKRLCELSERQRDALSNGLLMMGPLA